MRGPKKLFGLSPARLLGIVLVPLTIVGVMLWGLWNPTARMQNVTAVIVNNDEPVTLDGQIVPLGRVLAAELVGEKENNFDWVLSNDEEAAAGLKEGKYVAVVTIPEDFSAGATSISEGPATAQQTSIGIATAAEARLLDTALVETVTQIATKVINQQLSTSFVDGVFVGMNELGDGLGQVGEGAEELADGQKQLATGMQELAIGASQLAGGIEQLSSGSYGIASGTSESAAGAREYAAGVQQFSNGLGMLAGGAQENAAGAKMLADGVSQYVTGINSVLVPLSQELANSDVYIAEAERYLLQVVGLILQDEGLSDETKELILAQVEEGQGYLGLLQQMLEGTPEELAKLVAGGEELSFGMQQSADGSQQIAENLNSVSAGSRELAAGAADLAAGLGQLADGAHQVAGGTSQLSANMPELVDGANQLAEGTKQTAEGAEQISAGLGQITAEIPSYTEAERETLAQVAVEPVVAEGTSGKLFSDTSTSLFLATGLWAGGLALFLAVSPLNRRTRDAAGSEGMLTIKNAKPSLIVGTLQGLLVASLAAIVLDINGVQTLKMFALSVVAGVVFALLNQALAALFGGYGRFASLLLLVTVFVSGIVSTVPALMQQISAFTPSAAFMSAVARILSESGSAAALTAGILVWGAAGLVGLFTAVRRERAAVKPN